jgi:peptidoglycan/xylan/chitin deacetylase (PgdA/CDA1 family)
MPFWKHLLLNFYYHTSYPLRMCNYWWEVSHEHLPILVFCYHRVADDCANSWTTSCGMFCKQIQWLSDHFRFISLEEAQQRIRCGHNYEPCASITFDDGYSDNCRHAIPFLIKNRIPCTYFVTLRNVMAQEPFAHDLVVGNNHLLPNTMEQLRAMADAGVDIGVHAYTHIDLGGITDPRLLRYEIVTAGDDLEAALGRRPRYFAFPYGLRLNLNPAAFEIARQAGYEAVCSAYGGYNYPGDDAFHIQRIPIDNNMIQLKNWATLDPRKRHIPRFQYSLPIDNPAAADSKPKKLVKQSHS